MFSRSLWSSGDVVKKMGSLQCNGKSVNIWEDGVLWEHIRLPKRCRGYRVVEIRKRVVPTSHPFKLRDRQELRDNSLVFILVPWVNRGVSHGEREPGKKH